MYLVWNLDKIIYSSEQFASSLKIELKLAQIKMKCLKKKDFNTLHDAK